MEAFRKQEKLHRKYAYQVVLYSEFSLTNFSLSRKFSEFPFFANALPLGKILHNELRYNDISSYFLEVHYGEV